MVDAALNIYEETRLRRLNENTVNKKVHHVFKDVRAKALPGIYTKL